MDISHEVFHKHAKIKQEPTDISPEKVTIETDIDCSTNNNENEVQEASLKVVKDEDSKTEGNNAYSEGGKVLNDTFDTKTETKTNSLQKHPSAMDKEIDEDELQKTVDDQDDTLDIDTENDVNEVATENIFVCSVCNEMFETKRELIEHKKENNDCHEHKKCDECEIKSEEGFTCIWDLMQHLEAEHKVEHQDDLELLAIQRASIKQKTDVVKDLNSCSICQKSFYSKYTLRTHQMIHSGQKPFQCKICHTFCSTRSKLKIHQLIHSEKKPFQCSFCQRSFSFKYKWIQHERTHTDDKPFKCQGCDKSFPNELELREHEESRPEGKPIQCKFCCKSFSYASKCLEHERLHTGEKPFQCKFCDKRFSLRSTAKNHQRTHTGERPYVCRFCQQTFPFSSSWRDHETSHTIKNIPCNFCSKTFSCIESAKKHESVHLKKSELKHHCSYCGESFYKRWDLISHEKNHTHPYVCNSCKKRFSDKKPWRDHELTHVGRSFTCGICSKSYGHRSNLTRHMRKHK